MKLHHGLLRELDRPVVAAIGFFDGVHRGHLELMRTALRMRRPGWRSAVITFANHPTAYLRPGEEPPLICTPEERLGLFARVGFDECFFVPFDEQIAKLTPQGFVRDVLVGSLGVRGVVVGSTFRFGHKRAGDAALMASLLAEHDVAFTAVENLTHDGERISSTRIRDLIAGGDLELADHLLGHSYELRGTVDAGTGRGHDLGFPTANVRPPNKLLPKDGVYAATAQYNGGDHAALVSIGTNPTFDGREQTIEAWLRDFHETIYGRELAVRDLRYLRPQRAFETQEALVEQMREDTRAIAFPAYG